MKFRNLAVALAGAALMLGCGGSEDASPGGSDRSDEAGQALAPSYGVIAVSTSEVCRTEAGSDTCTDDPHVETVRYAALISTGSSAGAAVSEAGTAVSGSLRFCDIEMPQASVDRDFVRGLEPLQLSGQLQSSGTDVILTLEPVVSQLGVRLDDAAAALPTDGSDPQIVDQDGDGNEGITMRTGLFGVTEVYMAMRARLETDAGGSVLRRESRGDATVFTGTYQLSLDFEVFGDNVPLFDAVEHTRDIKNTTRVLSEEHSFELHPLSDDASCDDLAGLAR